MRDFPLASFEGELGEVACLLIGAEYDRSDARRLCRVLCGRAAREHILLL
jgi:hypothetical protein